MPPRKVLLVGWDAADWKIIQPLRQRGRMPAIDSLVTAGIGADLRTMRPALSPILWNSIATGKRPVKHGIHGFVEPDPFAGGVRPVSSTSRKAKAIWNILSQEGFKAHVLGWFASHPAEAVNGSCLSDLYAKAAPGHLVEPWPLAPDSVHPESLRALFSGLRVRPSAIEIAELLAFVPDLLRPGFAEDTKIGTLRQVLAETHSLQNAAEWTLRNTEWDFLAVYYNGIDHVSHDFMSFRPPKMDHIPDDQFALYRGVVDHTYCLHDLFLGRLIDLAGKDATVIVLSDHGFVSGKLRARLQSVSPEAMDYSLKGSGVHREFGVLVARGAGIRAGETVHGAGLLDITPTILALFGLPVGKDMDGKVLSQAFVHPPEPNEVPSWEDPAQEGSITDLSVDPVYTQAVLQQFANLGYIEAQPEGSQQAALDAAAALDYNLAHSLMNSGKIGDALPIFHRLNRDKPNDARCSFNLAYCYFRLGNFGTAQEYAGALLAKIGQAEANGIEAEHYRALAPWAMWLMGSIRYLQGDRAGALSYLKRAEEGEAHLPDLFVRLGSAYLQLGRIADAERMFDRGLEIDPENCRALLGKAAVQLRAGLHAVAAETALTAIRLQHFLPLGHYYLGLALARLNRFDQAVGALKTAVSQAPGFSPAQRSLLRLSRVSQ
jgi:tetratricopeptide (TPR) repeat protein